MSFLLASAVKFNSKVFRSPQKDVPIIYFLFRNLTHLVPSIYDTEDPAPRFFAPQVQTLLKRLSRPEIELIFRKRTNKNEEKLRAPIYKFLTDEELQKEIRKAHRKADKLLQMPPVVQVQKPIDKVVSKDPALIGHDTSKYVFTDITFGIDNEHRIIVERDTEGTLRYSDHDVRKRMNQVYFPINGRRIREPLMFSNEDYLNNLLEKEKYEFVLDRACIQYEPDEAAYQRVTSIVYQHLDSKRNYQLLRSTRHFGPLSFYLTWHRCMDGLLLDMIQNGVIREAVCLVALRHKLRGDVVPGDESLQLVNQITAEPLYKEKSKDEDLLSEDDIQLNAKCIEIVDSYVKSNSTMKSQQEIALQAYREYFQQQIELSRGLRKAHGQS